ncbi:hypothetical protein FGRMN_914 [Fusarium graminum]|nr:hypothetical protein FGRMN_914 [Fusarium graminum]
MAHYSDLLDDKHFRLATIGQGIHPDTGDQLPNVTLTTHSLSRAAEIGYNTLSYTWGSPRVSLTGDQAKQCILFNGKVIGVQANLYDALFELRTSTQGIPIWIDALCINQFSDAERSAQVSVMNLIYGKASKVIVWLGEAYPELEAGIKAAERIGTQSVPHTLRMLGTQTWDFTSDMSLMPERYNMEPITEEEVIGLIHLLSSTWFTRVWVIQEVSLAKDVVVLCDGKFTPFDCVGLTATFIHYSGLILPFLQYFPRNHPVSALLPSINIYQSERLQLLREWCKGEASLWRDVLSTIDFQAGLSQHENSASLLMLRLLHSTFGFEASDPRDIIYGLGGILKHMASEQGLSIPSDFVPDYTIGVSELFQNVSRKIMETTDSLVLLTLAMESSKRKIRGLSSWAMNYSTLMCNSIHGPQFKSVGAFAASQHAPTLTSDRHFVIDGNTLHITGFSLGTVQKTAEDYEESYQGGFDRLADLLLAMESTYPYTNQPADEALWRTLIWDNDLSNRPSKPPNTESLQRAVWKQITLAIKYQSMAQVDKSVAEKMVSTYIDKIAYLDKVVAKYPSSFFPSVKLVKSACVKEGLIKPDEGEDLVNNGELERLETSWTKNTMPPHVLLAISWLGRRPILTDTGYLGLGYSSVAVEDEVWIVSGSPAPLILRKTGSSDNEYYLVGEAYVHGAMHGEAIDHGVNWTNVQIV